MRHWREKSSIEVKKLKDSRSKLKMLRKHFNRKRVSMQRNYQFRTTKLKLLCFEEI